MPHRRDNSLQSAVPAMRSLSLSPARGSLYSRSAAPVRVPERSYMFSHRRSGVDACESAPEASLLAPAGAYLPSHCRSAGCLRTLAPVLSPPRTAAPTPETPTPRLAARTAPHLIPPPPSPLRGQKEAGNRGRSRVGAVLCYA